MPLFRLRLDGFGRPAALTLISLCLFSLPTCPGWSQDAVSSSDEGDSQGVVFPVDDTPFDPHPRVAPAIKEIDSQIDAGPFSADWKSLEGVGIPEWYQDAKLGIFIHWGAYSVPAYASEWYPRMMYIPAGRRGKNMFQHHLDTYGPQAKFGYKDFIPQFKAEKFDAERWVDLFVDAGAKYIVPVAEHHDGFPMYDCSFTEWDSSQMGPQRDVIAELKAASGAKGLKFGVSSHRAFNWMYYIRRPGYDNVDTRYAELYGRPMPFLFDDRAPDYRSFFPPQDKQFKDNWLARTCELVDKYDPDLVWFDFGITASEETSYQDNHYSPYLQRFAAYYYNQSTRSDKVPGIINYKWKAFPEKAAVLDLERSKMDAIRYPFWQTDTAVSSSSWGYTQDQKYKSPDRLIDDLIDIVSKNGCLLLNVGPRSDGTIPEEDQAILRTLGAWLKTNGEAIYQSRPWKIYGEGPTGTATGHLAESKDKPFTSQDIRFTTQGDTLYAIALAWPESGSLAIRALGKAAGHRAEPITTVKLVGIDGNVTFEQTEDSLRVTLPPTNDPPAALVLKIGG